MIPDLAVLDAHDIDGLKADLTIGGSDPKKRSLMGAVVGFVSRHSLAISKLPVDLCMKVRERNTKTSVEFSHTGFVGSRAWLRCVIDEIICEEFFESVEVSSPLNLFGVSPKQRLLPLRTS